MSGGDRARLVIGGPEAPGVAAPLERVAAAVCFMRDEGRCPVIIGGVAVMARVASAQRATADLDSALAVDVGLPATVELLEAAGVAKRVAGSPQRVAVAGAVIDCIDTLPVTDGELADYTDKDALFLGGHRFAHETAEGVTLVAGDIAMEVAVATPAGLVATKVHAARYRRRPEKLASDAFDLYQLATGCGPTAIAAGLARWPLLAGLVRDSVALTLVRDATRAARRLQAGDEAMAAVTDAAIETAGELLVSAIDEALRATGVP